MYFFLLCVHCIHIYWRNDRKMAEIEIGCAYQTMVSQESVGW